MKYADDTALSCKISKDSFSNDQLNYQMSVNNIVSVCDRKNLLLNSKKSKEMCFANVNIRHEGLLSSKAKSVTIHGSEVERVSKTIYLGVCIDENLTFNCHISKTLSKVYYIVSSFAYVVSFFNQSAKETVFRSVLPHIIYAVPVWYHFISCKDKQDN